MTLPGGTLDASFVLAVTGAAMLGSLIFGPSGAGLALIVAAGYFAVSAWLARRATEDAK